jgi:hypothetical protein
MSVRDSVKKIVCSFSTDATTKDRAAFRFRLKNAALEHFQAWWNTKRLRIMRQNKDLEQNVDSEKTHFALAAHSGHHRCMELWCCSRNNIAASFRF